MPRERTKHLHRRGCPVHCGGKRQLVERQLLVSLNPGEAFVNGQVLIGEWCFAARSQQRLLSG